MKPALKILLAVVGLVLVLLVGLAAAVALLFDPDDYRPLLEQSVEKSTGRKLTLEGELGLKLFPCCSITLGRTALGNPPGFPTENFASIESAALSIKVWPLITRRDVQIGVVKLDGLQANLLARADGTANWEFEGTEDETAAEEQGGSEEGELNIEGIEIRDGKLSYRDEQDGSAYLIEQLSLETGDISTGKPFDLELGAKLTDQSDGTTADIKLASTALLDPTQGETSKLTLTKPLMNIVATGKELPATSVTAKLGAAEVTVLSADDLRFDFKGAEGELTLPGMTALAGDLQGSFVAGDGTFRVGASSELSLPKLRADLTLSGAEVPGESVAVQIETSELALDVDKMLGSVSALKADVNVAGARLVVTGAGRLQDGGADMTGKLDLDPVSPRSLLAILREPEPKTADPKALTRLSGTADWALAKDSIRLPKLNFKLDDTQLTGSLAVANFETPSTTFDLALDAIDLDRYLEPEAPEGTAKSGKSGGAETEDIPVETIRGLDLDGKLRIARLVFAKAQIAGFSATLRAKNGKLRLDPVVAKAYGGEYRGSIAIDATGPQAAVELDQKISALQVGSVLKDLYANDKLTGALTGSIRAGGTGNSSEALLRTLAGNVSVSLADGAYLGTDIWHEIRSARALIRRNAPPPKPANPQTKLQAMDLAGTIRDGTLRTDKLLAEIPFLRLSGGGALDLVGKTMDYKLQAKVFETPTFEDGYKLDDLEGLTIPLTLKGAMDAPKVSVDLKNLATGVATQKLRDRLIKKLGGDEPELDGVGTGTTQVAPKAEKPRDALKRSLRDLLKQKEEKAE